MANLEDVKMEDHRKEPVEKNPDKKKRGRGLIAAAAVLLVILLIAGGVMIYRERFAVEAIVTIQVNPGIEIKINEEERVLSCRGLNADGRILLEEFDEGEDLENTDIEVAVGALVNALVSRGHLGDDASLVLITVENKRDEEDGRELQQELIRNANAMLQNMNVRAVAAGEITGSENETGSGAAGQNPAGDTEENEGSGSGPAPETSISPESSIASGNPEDSMGDTSSESSTLPEETTSAAGLGGNGDIGQDAALALALAHAGLTEEELAGCRIRKDYDDGRQVYEVEFWQENAEYEYEVDAVTGEVIKYDKDVYVSTGADASEDIGEDGAKAIALEHAGLTESQVTGLRVERKTHNGRRMEYEVEFWYERMEYQYEISGSTGEILEYEWDD